MRAGGNKVPNPSLVVHFLVDLIVVPLWSCITSIDLEYSDVFSQIVYYRYMC